MTVVMNQSFIDHSRLEISGFGSLGENVKISSDARFYGDMKNIRLGSNVRIDDFVVIVATGTVDIGDFTHIGAGSQIHAGGGFFMGDFSALSGGCLIYSTSDNFDGDWFTNPTCPDYGCEHKQSPVTLNKHVILGAGAIVLPGVTFGEGCAVAAGATVPAGRHLEPWTTWAGVPAKRLGDRKQGVLAHEARAIREAETYAMRDR